MELKDISNDLLGNIMSRLGGTALASIACACSELRDLARDETHWKLLCNSAWPSTRTKEVNELISSSVAGGFAELYASSYPLIVYDDKAATTKVVDVHALPGDLVSLVDVFIDGKCMLSRVLDGIPQAVVSDQKLDDIEIGTADGESQRWFPSSPFRWDCLDQDCSTDKASSDNCPCEDRSEELTETLRLSWILLDKTSYKAVNLSSWKPISVHREGPFDGSYVAQFGCVVPVDQTVLPHKLGKCVVTARFNIGANCVEAGSSDMRELSLEVEDIDRAKLNTETSLKILNQALISSRSKNQLKVEEGLRKFEEQKSKLFKRKEFTGKLAGRLFVLVDIAVIVTCAYTLRFLF